MSDLHRIIWHWTAGGWSVNQMDINHYHFVIDGKGAIHLGKYKPEDNISTNDFLYAAHTLHCNTGSIGVSIAAMMDACESDPWRTKFPPTEAQIDTLVELCTSLGEQYEIKVSPQTMLGHCEVEPVLGIRQKGKWDISVLPWDIAPYDVVGDYLRARIAKPIEKVINGAG